MTTTASYLQTSYGSHLAITAVVGGLNYVFTTCPDDDATVQAMFASTDFSGATVHRGLMLIGQRTERCDLWNPTLKHDAMTLEIIDDRNVVSGLFLRDAHSTTPSTRLYSDADCNDTQISVYDGSVFGTGEFYLGTEYFTSGDITNNPSPPDTINSITRGVRSLFTTESAAKFAPPHRVDIQTNARPTVSEAPLTFLNRPVIVRVHHMTHGSWATAADAYTVFVGRIKAIGERAGMITLECTDYREIMQRTIPAQRFEGTLREGIYFTTAMADISMSIRRQVSGSTTITSWDTPTATLTGTGAYITHQELSGKIADQLLTWANAGTIPGLATYSAAWSVTQPAEENGRYRFQATIGSAASTDVWTIKLTMHRSLWQLLGWGHDVDPTQTWSVDSDDTDVFTKVAPDLPLRVWLGLPSDGTSLALQIAVENVTGTFATQPSMPDFAPSDWSGFLKIGDRMIVACNSLTATTFEIARFTRIEQALVELGGTSEFQTEWRDDGTAQGITVKQFWLETGSRGDMMIKLMLSTGTSAYNHSTLDTYGGEMGLAIPYSIVNVDEIREHLGSDPYVLVIDDPIPFPDIIKKACAVAGCTPPQWVDGLITIRPLGSEAPSGESTVALTEDNKSNPDDKIYSVRSTAFLINRVTLKYQKAIGGEYKQTAVVNQVASQSDYETVRGLDVEGMGVYTGLTFAGDEAISTWATLVAARVLNYFSKPLVILQRSIGIDLVTRLAVGTKVTLTDNSLTDPRTGTRGVTSLPCWVIGFDFNWSTGQGMVELAFLPSLVGRLAMWGPSARLDTTAFSGGYSTSTKQIALTAHGYSHTSQSADVNHYPVGSYVHLVELSKTSPREWYDRVISATVGSNLIGLSAGLSSWSATGEYVLEYDDASTVVQAQLNDYIWIADDGNNSTGKAANDAYVYGGTPLTVSDFTDSNSTSTAYRKIPTAADDTGEPLSVHKAKDLADFGFCALERVTAPCLLDAQMLSANRTAVTGTTRTLVWGPERVPLPGGTRPIKVTIYGSVDNAGSTATFRIVSSTGPVSGASDTSLTYPDGGGVYIEVTRTGSTALGYLTETSLSPALVPGYPAFTWITVEAVASTAGVTATLAGIAIREAGA